MRLYKLLILLLVSAMGFVSAGGCSRGPKTEGVGGTVKMDGAPLDNIRVTFQPKGSAGAAGIGSTGVTDDRGHFVLKRVDNDAEGAVVATHSVTFTDKLAEAGAADSADAGPASKTPKSRIPDRYSATPMTFEVKAGDKNEANFELKSSP